jgi:hypothetical protein
MLYYLPQKCRDIKAGRMSSINRLHDLYQTITGYNDTIPVDKSFFNAAGILGLIY